MTIFGYIIAGIVIALILYAIYMAYHDVDWYTEYFAEVNNLRKQYWWEWNLSYEKYVEEQKLVILNQRIREFGGKK